LKNQDVTAILDKEKIRGPFGDLVAITLRQKAEKCNRSGVWVEEEKAKIEGGRTPAKPPSLPLSLHFEVIIVTNSS